MASLEEFKGKFRTMSIQMSVLDREVIQDPHSTVVEPLDVLATPFLELRLQRLWSSPTTKTHVLVMPATLGEHCCVAGQQFLEELILARASTHSFPRGIPLLESSALAPTDGCCNSLHSLIPSFETLHCEQGISTSQGHPLWHEKTVQMDVKVEAASTQETSRAPRISKLTGRPICKYTRKSIPSSTTSSNNQAKSNSMLRKKFLIEVSLFIDKIASEAASQRPPLVESQAPNNVRFLCTILVELHCTILMLEK